jgi:Zn-dependent M28 family amino/carboxypeptidase
MILGAHYDTARGSLGVNDNASGMAALLALACSFAHQRVSRTLRLVAFTNEERPFLRTPTMGSRVYARRCREREENIKAMISLETVGYCSDEKGSQWLSFAGSIYPNRGDFIVFVANPSSKELLNQATQSFRRIVVSTVRRQRSRAFFQARRVRTTGHSGRVFPGLMVTDTAPLRYPTITSPAIRPTSCAMTS